MCLLPFLSLGVSVRKGPALGDSVSILRPHPGPPDPRPLGSGAYGGHENVLAGAPERSSLVMRAPNGNIAEARSATGMPFERCLKEQEECLQSRAESTVFPHPGEMPARIHTHNHKKKMRSLPFHSSTPVYP
jgi:hypothetical protein